MNTPMNTPVSYPPTRWVRSKDGMIAGVCEGIAKRLGMESWIIRVLLIISTFCFFTGPLIYLGIALSLPREDRVPEAYSGMFLGVCAKISKRTELEIGIVRGGMILLLFSTFGFAFFAYIVLAIFMPDQTKPNLRN